MTARVPRPKPEPKGHAKPRIAPPTPARSSWKEHVALAASLGIAFYPWQETAARYLYALGPGDRPLYPEVAIIVARQNGKTELLKSMIVDRLRRGHKVMHTAQNAKLPRDIHEAVAELVQEHYADDLPKRRAISYAIGHEEIKFKNGGRYRIVAPTKGGARGPKNDLVIIDELREMDSHEFIAAAEPTLLTSDWPQMVYLSNAGSDESVVLNQIKARAGADPSLAYLEWSAAPERDPDDERGWLEANPSAGHHPGVFDYLRRKYESYRLAGTLGIFETEHLCRWVRTTLPALVASELWDDALTEAILPVKPTMGVGLDPSGLRASAAIAWQDGPDYRVEIVADVRLAGDVEAFGPELVKLARQLRVSRVVGDPYSEPLLRYFERGFKVGRVTGREFVTASEDFVRLLEARKLRWQGTEDAVGADLPWATRHTLGEHFLAVPTKADHPIPALLAAIRAVGDVAGPRTTGLLRVE